MWMIGHTLPLLASVRLASREIIVKGIKTSYPPGVWRWL